MKVGTPVTLHSLRARPELNGRRGVVRSFDAEMRRHGVEVEGELRFLALKPDNLEELQELEAPLAPTAAPAVVASEEVATPEPMELLALPPDAASCSTVAVDDAAPPPATTPTVAPAQTTAISALPDVLIPADAPSPDAALIVELAAPLLRVGWAGQERPSYAIPTTEVLLSDLCGATMVAAFKDVGRTLNVDWPAHPVCVVLHAGSVHAVEESVVNLFLHILRCPAVHIASAFECALFAHGRISGVVVDCSSSWTTVATVEEELGGLVAGSLRRYPA